MKHYHFILKITLFLNFLLVFGIVFSLSGCSSDKKNYFISNPDCNVAKKDCLNKCRSQGKSELVCLDECEKVRGMCAAMKTKGCLQNCNLQYGKGTKQAEQCKARCGR